MSNSEPPSGISVPGVDVLPEDAAGAASVSPDGATSASASFLARSTVSPVSSTFGSAGAVSSSDEWPRSNSEPPPKVSPSESALASGFAPVGGSSAGAAGARSSAFAGASGSSASPPRSNSDPLSPTGPGNLEPRLVQAGIRARYGRVRSCYRTGFQRNPNLRGEVKVRFVIDRSGHVSRVEDAGSKLKDKQVLACITGEFAALRFPHPEIGNVIVVYPMIFGPGDIRVAHRSNEFVPIAELERAGTVLDELIRRRCLA